MRNERGSRRTGRTAGTSKRSTSSDQKRSGGKNKSSRSGNDSRKTGSGYKKTDDKDRFEKRERRPTDKPAFKKKFDDKRSGSSEKGSRSFDKKPFGSKPVFKKKYGEDRDKRSDKNSDGFEDKKKGAGKSFAERKEYKKRTGIKTYTDKDERTYTKETEIVRGKNANKSFKKVKVYQKDDKNDDGSVRLNKYIANAGICSRREADTYIETGVVTVNGVVITELGYKVKPGDRVLFHDKPIIGEKHVYILLNKPKDYITTSKDPQNRKTVLELISGVKERIFPVGRLDRNTTGVLLLTNDGALAEKLMHPRKGVAKIYHVELDRKFTAPDLEKMRNGLELEDGFFTPDEVDYAEGMDKHHVGIEIHSGANRIVRRLFESLNYNVIKLDRVVYAGLTKKGLTRGKWRFLKDSELHALRMM